MKDCLWTPFFSALTRRLTVRYVSSVLSLTMLTVVMTTLRMFYMTHLLLIHILRLLMKREKAHPLQHHHLRLHLHHPPPPHLTSHLPCSSSDAENVHSFVKSSLRKGRILRE